MKTKARTKPKKKKNDNGSLNSKVGPLGSLYLPLKENQLARSIVKTLLYFSITKDYNQVWENDLFLFNHSVLVVPVIFYFYDK